MQIKSQTQHSVTKPASFPSFRLDIPYRKPQITIGGVSVRLQLPPFLCLDGNSGKKGSLHGGIRPLRCRRIVVEAVQKTKQSFTSGAEDNSMIEQM